MDVISCFLISPNEKTQNQSTHFPFQKNFLMVVWIELKASHSLGQQYAT
jgi:hypothetical protein